MASSWVRRIGLRLAPLLRPREDEERGQIREILSALRRQQKTLEAQREDISLLGAGRKQADEAIMRMLIRFDARLSKSVQDMEQWRDETIRSQRRDFATLAAALKGIRGHLTRKGAFTHAVLERARRVPRQRFLEQTVHDRLARIAASGRPIIAGPWTGEVGFELMYWAPFVRWFAGHFGIEPGRLTIVSRGGTRSWYGDVAASYSDVFEYVGAEQFRTETGVTGLKQKRLSAFDRTLARRITRDRGLPRVSILHPMYMYTLFRDFFAREEGIRHVFAHTAHRRIAAPDRAHISRLPDRYVAAKFYFRPSFPRTPENLSFIHALLEEIAAEYPIVLLDTDVNVDDHEDFTDPRFLRLSAAAAPTLQDNLEVQTAVIAGAHAFVGTYGGFSYLAPLCGVPAVTFYQEHLFYLYHRYMADVVCAQLDVPLLTMLSTSAAPLQRRAALDLLVGASRHS